MSAEEIAISELSSVVNELRESNRQLREELERAKLINNHACDDWSHDDTKVKELLKPHLPGDDLESDGYGFRGVIAVAELAAARFTALENALREAVKQLQRKGKCGGHDLNCDITHEQPRYAICTCDTFPVITKALQTLSDLNIK